jgi:hypothetical protein
MCGRPSGARVSRSHRCSSQSTGNERPRARDNRRENRDDLPPRHEHLLLKRTLLSVAVKHEPRVLRHRPPSPFASPLPLLEGCRPEVATMDLDGLRPSEPRAQIATTGWQWCSTARALGPFASGRPTNRLSLLQRSLRPPVEARERCACHVSR